MADDLRARMRAFYASSTAYKRLLDAHREAYLAPYVALALRHAPLGNRVLELGAGNGVSSRMFAEAGRNVVGTDVSPFFLAEASRWASDRLSYVACDGLQLPFHDASFDVVCSNEYLEHVPDAATALDEMVRVTAPGGRALILGPNLLSPFVGMREASAHWRGRGDALVWTRTAREALRYANDCRRAIQRKRRLPDPEFTHRDPTLADRAIGGDSDSAYLANPVDLERYFRRCGWRVIALSAGVGWKGRLVSRLFPYHSPNLCFVAIRPAQSRTEEANPNE